MIAVIICLCALCALFAVDICLQVFTAKKKVKQYRERKYSSKELEPRCVFVDFQCPHCKEPQHTAIECGSLPLNKLDVLGTMQVKIKRCPLCGMRLDWS